ncbi:tRNA dihydrouridine(20/20a) synthase DusA [Vallitalea okinawensis]|uniref:tRNA dihydrouridine(20/20a) synthase DusA n=1 Tax=Vallitalea okinawensis TaxID=2078660 RepID=UPI000CFC516B|nr:tRNA dihydrouridine(20/20a) synthase DusA [Vallitalea okinawensis]
MISIAPMVDRTDRYFRYFCRLISKEVLLYTEMITAPAIIHGDIEHLLAFDAFEGPVALQIAGTNVEEIFKATKIAEAFPYTEVNLNVGCPSDRVSGNYMGACLMAYPELVAEMVQAMKEATNKPVTVKHRIGIDGRGTLPDDQPKKIWDQYEDLYYFVDLLDQVGVDGLTIHARIAILAGLSPKENREVPPLRYEDVYRLKDDFPHIPMEVNGGITTCEAINEHLKVMDGVMLGRKAYDDPFFLAHLDHYLGHRTTVTRGDVIRGLIPYVERMVSEGHKGHRTLAHTINLFHGKRGSKLWKQLISPPWDDQITGKNILKKALLTLPDEVLNERP